ncbi:MAG: hypothetical protein U1F14_08930 [Steroidobacteraceae bacterium]
MVSGRGAGGAALWRRVAVGACLALLAGCGGVQVRPAVTLPTPLVEKTRSSIGVFYPDEFRKRTHSEERRNIKFNVDLGAASIATIDRVLGVMFDRIVPLRERGEVTSVVPPVALVLVPYLDEYSFVTPQEMASSEYAVTIRYRFELLDPKGLTVDQLTLTGFGTAPAGRISTAAPLNVATQTALRDLAAKFIVDFPQQDSVVRLLHGDTLPPLATGQQEVATSLGVFEAPPGDQAPGASAAAGDTASAAGPEPAVPEGPRDAPSTPGAKAAEMAGGAPPGEPPASAVPAPEGVDPAAKSPVPATPAP